MSLPEIVGVQPWTKDVYYVCISFSSLYTDRVRKIKVNVLGHMPRQCKKKKIAARGGQIFKF